MTHTQEKNKIQIHDLNKIMEYVKSLEFDKYLEFDKEKKEAAFCLLENCKTRVEKVKDKLIYELNLEIKEILKKERIKKEREDLEKGNILKREDCKMTRYQQVKACLKLKPLKVTYDYSSGSNDVRKYVLFKEKDDDFKKFTKNSKTFGTYGRGYFLMINEKLHLLAFHHDFKTPTNAPKHSIAYDVRISEKGIYIID